MNVSELPHNLWFRQIHNYVDWNWYHAGLLTVGNLPTIYGKIDLSAITSHLNEVGYVRSPFLLFCSFQPVFSSYLDKTIQGSFLPSEMVILYGKALLQASISAPLSLDKWCLSLQLLLLEIPEMERIFRAMLVQYKITKFREINFKILAWILAIPKIISCIKKAENLQFCYCCGAVGSLEHVLLVCKEIQLVHNLVAQVAKQKFLCKHWIFGYELSHLNPFIWIMNFTIYKCHILACEGQRPIFEQMYIKLVQFTPLFKVLQGTDLDIFL